MRVQWPGTRQIGERPTGFRVSRFRASACAYPALYPLLTY